GLTEDAVARLLARTSQGPAGVAAALHRRTEGHPAYLTELLRALPREQLLDPSLVATCPLPPALHHAVGQRLASLSQGCRAVLRVAAVLGREFAAGPLATVSGV